MLTIRKEQMELLAQSQQQPIALKTGLALRERHPHVFQHYTDAQMQNWVTRQIDYLKQYGIARKEAVLDVIELLALCGEQFERCADRSWAMEILEDTEQHDGIRAVKLERTCEVYFKELDEGDSDDDEDDDDEE